MRTLAITQNITVDGSIEFLTDWYDPDETGDADQADILAETHAQDERADALLLGRQTFEDFRGHWQLHVGDTSGIADYLNSVNKYVVSSTLEYADWQHTTLLDGDFIEQVTALKNAPGKDIVVTGSISLCHGLIRAALVDEFRLFTYPVVQGRGRRLFPEGVDVPSMRLNDAKQFRSGVTYASYRVEN